LANIILGNPNPPSSLFGGLLPQSLNFTGWARSNYPGGATFTRPFDGPPRPTETLTLTLDANNNVTSVKFELSNGTSLFPGFIATGISIPFATLLANASDLMPLLLAGNDTIQGNIFADTINAGAGDDQIFGGGGNDVLSGGAGNDVLTGGSGNDQLVGDSGNDELRGSDGDDKMFGGDGDDLLIGSSGSDDLRGGEGNDILLPGTYASIPGISDSADGGAGIDTVSFADVTVAVRVRLAEYFAEELVADPNIQTVRVNLFSIENAIGGSGNDALVGDDNANVLSGLGGNDSLRGLGGNDTLYGGDGDDLMTGSSGADLLDGGAGTDTADYTDALSGVTVDLAGTGTRGEALGDTYVSIERVNGTRFDDTMTGGGGFGSTLLGGGGNDTLYGGTGAFNYLYGGDGVDTLIGGSGRDYLSPGSSTSASGLPDVVDGGSGIDTITYAEAAISGMDINLAAGIVRIAGGQRVEATVANVENVVGGSGNDLIVGNSFGNELYGGSGDDILSPGKAIVKSNQKDIVDGGGGSDTVSFANTQPDSYGGRIGGVSVNLTTGQAIEIYGGPNGVWMSATLISIENAVGTSGNDQLSGNTGVNVLSGGAGSDGLYGGAGTDTLNGDDGDDFLNGGLGADKIYGGTGIDRAEYVGAAAGVTVNLTSGTASDGDVLTGIENLYGSSFNDILYGSAAVNVLYGNTGDDQLLGLLGNDTLYGQAGNDALFCGEGDDAAYGGDGSDGLFGEEGADRLFGGDGDDFLSGGDGNDVIWGEAGNDQIDAGAGNDFAVLGAGDDEFTLGLGDDRIRFDYGNGADTIRDFGAGNDIIDFTYTDMTLAALQANTIQTGAGVLMTLGSGSILLAGLQLSQIDWAGDFVFAV
jgi:Ca2+-binding RTX toxin-like protein